MGKFFKSTKVYSLDEVGFANHLNEFIRFYERHKTLCDEIAGVKKRIIILDGTPTEIIITRSNFFQAIKKLNSFIIDNLHYIYKTIQRNEIISEISSLEQRFLNDGRYKEFVKLEKNLSIEDEVEFNKLYFNYVFDCFELSYFVFKELQDSLMITTRDKTKAVKYYDTKKFFENLSLYRDEISSSLSDIRLSKAFNHFKKVVGYYYTYKFIVSKDTIDYVDSIIRIVYSYIVSPAFIELVKIASRQKVEGYYIQELYNKTLTFKQMLSEIYLRTNESLSERNVLPKIEKKITIDKTLI